MRSLKNILRTLSKLEKNQKARWRERNLVYASASQPTGRGRFPKGGGTFVQKLK